MGKKGWTDREVEAHWDRVADIYVRENDRVKATHDQRFREAVGYLELSGPLKVLNITSRDCEANDYIRSACSSCDVLNAEISSGLMRTAERIRPYVRQIKLESYSDLPFDDRVFDRVISLETIEHAAEPVQFLKELNRVSRTGAVMVLSCPPATSEVPYRIYSCLFGGHGEGPHRFPSSGTVKKWLARTGWTLLNHKGTILIPVGPQWLQQWGEKIIEKFQKTFISELGIRQFYVCRKQ
ncbi:MAG: methyltransferase domain-containing protein [Bacteroidales bacterium]|nr:methyltransferase domain-containing protein [Bacteroidales bacterium]MBN2698111.1 methyltransferase domain-containing protein [Bacteroidales bacterium]